MKTTAQINLTLTIAKQDFDELVRLRSIERLKQQDFGEGAQRQRVASLLARLIGSIAEIERHLKDHLRQSDSSPVVEGAPQLVSFYRDELKPNSRLIKETFLQLHKEFFQKIGLWGLVSDRMSYLYPESEQEHITGVRVRNTIEAALNFFDETIDEEDERRDESFSFEGAWDIIDHQFVGFRPDEWLQNLRLLEPVLTGKPKATIPQRIQLRLFDAYQGFVLNQWFGVIALSRAILEDNILTHADRLGINPYSNSTDGKRQGFKHLGELIYLVSKKHPELKNDMKTIKRAGDRILHPKKTDVTSHPHIFRKEALECLQGIKRIVEYVYAD